MAEKTMRQNVIKALRELDAISVENPVYPGTPDVNYIDGWIELKWMRRWPENADRSPVLIPHFTPQQRVWLARRWRKGGNAFLLLQVGLEWLLFDGETAGKFVGKVTRPELMALRRRYSDSGMRGSTLRSWMETSGHSP